MMNRQRQRGQVLIILFVGTLLLGASAGGMDTIFGDHRVKEMRKALKGIVADEQRRKRTDAVLDDMQKASRAFVDEHKHEGKALLALMSRHDATPEEFDRVFARTDEMNARTRRALLDDRERLRAELNAQEWEALFSPRK